MHSLAILVPLFVPIVLSAEAWQPQVAERVTVSGPASPEVQLAVERLPAGLRVMVIVEPSMPGAAMSSQLGLAARRHVVLGEKDATAGRLGDRTTYTFEIPAARLVDDEADWGALRLAAAVAWKGGPAGADQQRERFRHLGGAPHAGLSVNPSDWQPFDLKEHAAQVSDRKRAIVVEFSQPVDGKATIVVEDATGRRVRNLIAGQPIAAGSHQIAWDGLDEQGNVVAAGEYSWRAISHTGLQPDYLFSFANDGTPPWRTGTGTDMWGPDHSVLMAATAGREWTFMGGSCAESGYAIVAVDAAGVKRMHYNPPHGTGLAAIALAADDKYLYAMNDGFSWGQKVDRNKPDWKADMNLSLTRFDIANGQIVPYGKDRFVVVSRFEVGPGSSRPQWEGPTLAGAALLGGKLYIADKARSRLIVVDTATAEAAGEIAMQSPGPLCAVSGQLAAVSKGDLVRIDPAGKRQTTIAPLGEIEPAGIAVDRSGRFLISDARSHTIKVLDAAGKPVDQLGTPGGPYAGAYDRQRLVNPRGMAIAPNGWLWVTEERWNPKRASAWDLAKKAVVCEKFGPTAYGAPGAGIDAQDHTRWIGQGAIWQLDFEKRTAAPQSILAPKAGHLGAGIEPFNYTFHRRDGRTFLIGMGKVSLISELLPSGAVRDLAAVAECHQFSYAANWRPPQAYIDAFYREYPDRRREKEGTGDRTPYSQKGPGVLWVDRNGDGEPQAEEFSFSKGATNFGGSGWGHGFAGLTIRYPAVVDGKTVLVSIEPDGYDERGTPRYPVLAEAIERAVPIALEPGHMRHTAETIEDRFGNVLFNSAEPMMAFAPDGRTLWTYPNRWVGVHGSHDAPLPELGVMQGALFFLGRAPLDAAADVVVLNGNHGRFFAMTTDGLYLDEFFKDVRIGASVDAYLIGGECFGGCFGRSEKDGQYYLQSGHTDYRVFRIDGFQSVRRSEGKIAVSAEQALAAASRQARRAAETKLARAAVIGHSAAPPQIDGQDNDWPREGAVRWDRSGKFPVSLRLAYDDQHLYLCYTVEESSPWINGGKDWTSLFKTGDSVDLQLGTDPSADPKRREPVVGDLRLLIAPYQGSDIAVLYRHRAPGSSRPTHFNSPWRAETVDVVERITDARIAVRTSSSQYTVEAAVPLKSLGLDAPQGKTMAADFGVIYGDAGGAINMLRSYWSNPATGVVNDVPSEIMLHPNLWGTATFAKE
jgi:hypothetical protein